MSQNNLLLSSDFDVYQNFATLTLAVAVSGVTTGGGTRQWTAIDVSTESLPEFSTFLEWNGTTTPTAGPTYQSSGFMDISARDGTLSDGSTGAGYSLYPRVSVSGKTVTAIIELPNPYSLDLTVPARSFTFRIRAYRPPTN